MIRKTIGTILIIAGGALIIDLLSRGMIFPHVIGPTLLAGIGVFLLVFKQNKK